jgi:hypothetical protein
MGRFQNMIANLFLPFQQYGATHLHVKIQAGMLESDTETIYELK